MAPSRWFLAALMLNLLAAPAIAHEGDSLTPTPVPVAPPPPLPVGPAPARTTPWPFVLMGAGALTLGAGIWLVHRDHTDNTMPACTTAPDARTSCPYSTATQWQGWAFVAIGAQLAIAGAAWRFYEVRHATKTVSLVAGLGQLSLAGTF